ncbi:hypothetical protein BDF20DRAFT_872913 [Mycotypha africana]|uniref:uncharacterized protein n=1 Tax=Mycotypha africana TaxID=64632 RepID=UPI002301D4F8|nr:uncharacterized protein BDF20DRAFT_872913 [Mycotypha africana]KAI8977099.1 hypothetical protein BDF20DRAFT_872913 [Mycotypha africana]
MFQQFKNILPNTPINIRSLSESVGINDTEWSRNFERIGQLRNDFQSLNSFFQSRPGSSQSHSPEPQQMDDMPMLKQLKSTEKLLNKLSQKVEDVHDADIANFEKSKVADSLLRQLHTSSIQHYEVYNLIENSDKVFENMLHDIDSVQSTAVNLMNVLPELEKQIDEVSITHNQREFEIWKQNQEQQLQAEIQAKHQIIHEKEVVLQQKYEEFDKLQRQKKLEVYEATFNAQLEDFRRRKESEVSSIYSQQNGSSLNLDSASLITALNQLRLNDQDNDLDTFLGDATSSTSVANIDTAQTEESFSASNQIEKSKGASDTSDEDEDDGNGTQVEVLEDEDYVDF